MEAEHLVDFSEDSPLETKSKIITIKTIKNYNDFRYSEFFSEKWNARSYISYLEFSEPIVDFKSNENNKLDLGTIWFIPKSPYWQIYLIDNKQNLLRSISFGKLDESFLNYSKQKLEDWQKQAFEMHNRGLRKLENLFYMGGRLQENFLETL